MITIGSFDPGGRGLAGRTITAQGGRWRPRRGGGVMVEMVGIVAGVLVAGGLGEMGRRALLGSRLQRSMGLSNWPGTDGLRTGGLRTGGLGSPIEKAAAPER